MKNPVKNSPKDPMVLAAGGAVTSILSGLGLMETWGLTGDDVGLIIGGAATLFGILATVYHGRKSASSEGPSRERKDTTHPAPDPEPAPEASDG